MDDQRDPRLDPRPGDVLSNGNRTAHVLEIDERGMIFCERYEPYLTRCDRVYRFQILLEHFRACADAADVVVLAMGVPR